MDFTIDRTYFIEQLSSAARATAVHSPMPILSGILMDTRNEQLLLTGSSNTQICQVTILPGELSRLHINEPDAMAVDARLLLELLRRMATSEIHVYSLDTSMIRIESGDGKFDLVCYPAADYPSLDLERPETMVELPAHLLKDIVNQISYAAALKNVRTVLMGINLNIENGKLTATATDSYRMAIKEADVDCDQNISVTIPVSALADVARSADKMDKDAKVQLYLNRRKVQFIYNKTLFQTALYEGSFPDVQRVIPQSYVCSVTLDAALFTAMLSRSTIYISSDTGSCPVRLTCQQDSVSLTALAAGIGSCDQEIYGAAQEGQDIVVSFNAQLMLQALKGLSSAEKVCLEFAGEVRPIRITASDVPGVTMIVVPIRTA